MNLEQLRICWQKEPEVPMEMRREALDRLLEARASEVRRRIRGRLQEEVGAYLVILFLTASPFLADFQWVHLAGTAGVVALFGVIIVALWRVERRIADPRLDAGLRDALLGLRGDLDWAGRTYLGAYVLFVVLSLAVLLALTLWKLGTGLVFFGALAGGLLVLAWAAWSGRQYARRMFLRYRIELDACLAELDTP